MISIIIPTYKFGIEFLQRAIDSVKSQTYNDYEILTWEDTDGRGMGWNTNRLIQKANGELVKILFQDDWLAYEDALKDIVENFKGQWLITASNDNPNPYYTHDILAGNNKLGSPSALTIKNDHPLLFKNLNWALDCDYYKRMFDKYGEPVILKKVGVNLGKGGHQLTNRYTPQQKLNEIKSIL